MERRKYVDEWGDTNDSQISFLDYWIDGGTIYMNRKFAKIIHLVSKKSPLEPNLGRQSGYNFFFFFLLLILHKFFGRGSWRNVWFIALQRLDFIARSSRYLPVSGRYSQQRAIRLLFIWISSIQCSPSSPPSLQSYKARNIDTKISMKYTVKPQFFLKLFIFNWRIITILFWFLPYINMDQP